MTALNNREMRFPISKIAAYLIVIFIILFDLPPYLYIWGDSYNFYFILRVIICILIAAYLVWRGIFQKAALPRIGFEWALGIFALAVLLSWLFSTDQRPGLDLIASWIRYCLLFYLLLDAFETWLDRRALPNAFLFVTGILLTFSAIETYLAYSQWWSLVGSWRILPPFPYRFRSLVGHPNTMMALANLGAPLAIILFLNSKRFFSRLLLGIWIFFFILAIPFSSSRAGWLGTATWVTFLTIYGIWKKKWIESFVKLSRNRKLIIATGSLCGLVLLGFIGFKFAIIFSTHPTHGNNALASRSEIWQSAIDMWKLSPLTGVGPGRFSLEYFTTSLSTPPNFWAVHGHSIILQNLAELGLIGLAGLILLFVIIVLKMRQNFHLIDTPTRFFSIAIIASFAAWSIHGVLDDLTASHALMDSLIILLAWFFSSNTTSIERWKSGSFNIIWLPLVFLVALFGWTAWSSLPMRNATTAANDGNYVDAMKYAKTSQDRDSKNIYYESALALFSAASWNQTGNINDLEQAIDQFHKVTSRDTFPNQFAADLAVLEAQAGDFVSASKFIQLAIDRAPKEPSFYLNQGTILEKEGLIEESEHSYCQSITLKPEWVSSPFWQSTPVRSEAKKACVEQGSDIYIADYAPYWLQARRAIQSGNLDEAWLKLASSIWSSEDALAIGITSGILHDVRGETDQAIEDYESALESINKPILGRRNDFVAAYASHFGQPRLPFDLVSGYLQIQENVGQLAVIQRLDQYYQQQENSIQLNQLQMLQDQIISGQVYFTVTE
jgi:O-antigen ligase/tetratricopeptide (TPR) repeat protein